MFEINVPSGDLPLYLALEEAMMDYNPGPFRGFGLVEPCVILGRGRVDEKTNAEALRTLNVAVVRQPGTGGAIYADRNTPLYAVIKPGKNSKEDIEASWREAAEEVASALNKLGAPVIVKGRNDLVIETGDGDKKVAGWAMIYHNGYICSHAAIAYDTDLDVLEQVLLPDAEKLKSRGLSSVKSGVTTLKSYIGLDAAGFIAAFKQKLPQTTPLLIPPEVMDAALSLRRKYADADWIANTNTRADLSIEVSIEARKTLCGTCLTSGLFTFGLFDYKDNEVARAVNDGCGNIVFPNVSFTKPGVYNGTIRELNPSSCGWITDSREYPVTITVIGEVDEEKGWLMAWVDYPNGEPCFVNFYCPTKCRPRRC